MNDKMALNSDLSQRCVVNSHTLDWVASPAAGVSRRLLERDGGEVARATSVVSYAQGSAFDAHAHVSAPLKLRDPAAAARLCVVAVRADHHRAD
ncbi:cupin domain-containing protein [Limnohabitans sp. T6-20]|uniref:cupin domain-containing protein n=1 Tax=Limnohabitans sp. T6-20 TaxID=1100725 RepID=UPI001E5D5093|nr:cupin domain-containing protein [Limnohabitans sp. T6-20]